MTKYLHLKYKEDRQIFHENNDPSEMLILVQRNLFQSSLASIPPVFQSIILVRVQNFPVLSAPFLNGYL
jgi:hypothetical protein